MFNFKKLLAVIFLVAVLACILKNTSAGADNNNGWLPPTDLSLNVSNLNSLPGAQSNNIDCLADQKDICSYSTPYGLADSTGSVKLNGGSTYEPAISYTDARPHFFAIPNSSTAITYTTDPVYGAYLYFNFDFTASITRVDNPASGSYYNMVRPPDGKLADKSGHKLAADLPFAAFSQNGDWMVVSAPGIAMLRVNLRTFEVLPFAPGFSYDIGVSAAPVAAISNDGRYATFASKDFNRFALYDLNTCTAVPDTITGPASCQSRDLQAYMNSRVSGFTVPVGLRFISDDTLSFYGKYTEAGAAKPAKFIVRDNSEPIHQQDYLALGDSYISGEGAFKYLPGTDTDDNQCHLSSVSYPLLIGSQLDYNSFHSVACSGATMNDITNIEDTYKEQASPHASRLVLNQTQEVPPIIAGFQPGYIDQLDFVQQYQPKTLTLSIGGNDIGFSARLQSCLNVGTCYSTYEDRLEFVREVNQAFPRLVSTYSLLKIAGPDDMKIYVIGYPQIAKAGGDCALNVHMNESELEFAQQAIDYLDTVIKQAAAKAGVYYVDTQDALNGHRLCEAQPGSVAVNGITAGNDFPEWLGGPIGRESYHPNDFGHLLLENKILAVTHNLTAAMPTPDPAAAPPAEAGLPILDAPRSGRAVNVTEYDPNLTDDFAYQGTGAEVSISGGSHALGAGTNLQATLHSDPINLGSFKTDASGNLNTSLVIPASVPAGYHSLHFYGTDINGQSVDISKTIYVAATADDTDGNGISDSQQKCVGLDPSNIDFDQDGIDDACDANIGLPPTPSAAPVEVSAILSSGSSNLILLNSAPTEPSAPNNSSPDSVSDAAPPKVLAANTLSQPNSGIAKTAQTDLNIPAKYYLAAGLGFLALTSLSYWFRRL